MSNKPSRQPSASAKVRDASRSSRGSTTWLWVGLAVIVVVVGIVAVIIGRSSDSSSSASGGGPSPSGGTVVPNGDVDYGSIEVVGADLPAASTAAGAVDTAVGQTIPTIEGETFDGSPVTISSDGKPQVILVIAHWCPHCQAEVPRLQDWLDQNGMPSDVQLTAVATANTDQRENFPAGPWLREAGWSIPTMIDNQGTADGGGNDAARAVGVSAYPFFVVVDAQGKVVFRTSGEVTMPQWEQLLDSARTGQAPAGS